MVSRPGSIRARDTPGSTRFFSSERQLYRPVISAYREGEHTAEEAWQSVKRMPSRASRSMFSVWILDSGFMQDTSP